MSYFDEVIEPSLYKNPKIEVTEERDFSNPSTVPWISNDGRKLTIGQMANKHLLNAHALIGRRLNTPEQKEADLLYYGLLRGEINKRGL